MGIKHRLNHIFLPNGRTFILAIDHGANFNVLPAMREPGKLIRQCAGAGVDAFLVSPGLLDKFAQDFLGKGIILRIDGGVSMLSQEPKPLQTVVDPEEAIFAGADALVTMSFPGSRFESESLGAVARNIQKAHRMGLPVVVEALPRGFEGGDDSRTPQNLIFACRQAAELGADIVKTAYTGSVETMRELTESVFVPVVILGGSTKLSEEKLFQEIRDALDGGAAGIAIGRNIWGHENPALYSKVISKLIHEDLGVEDALKELRSGV